MNRSLYIPEEENEMLEAIRKIRESRSSAVCRLIREDYELKNKEIK